jgi:hypothetical protein
MTYKPYDEQEAVRGWWSGENNVELARRLGLTPRELYNRWKTLKKRGDLPKGKNRRGLLRAEVGDATPNDRYDGRPTTAKGQYEDALLQRLRIIHQDMVCRIEEPTKD